MAHVSYWLVPHPSRPAVLVDRSDGAVRLPCVPSAEFSVEPALEAARERLGFDIVFLRLCGYTGGDDNHPTGADDGAAVTGVRAAAAPPFDWTPPPGLDWLGLDELDAEAAAPPGFADRVDLWRLERLGRATPPRRAAWSREGWLEEASDWARAACLERGITVTGPIRQAWQWVLSSILRVPTDAGTLYLKAVFPLFHHEPAVTEALARRHPGHVPAVVATHRERGWLLMHEIPGTPLGRSDRERWAAGARLLAEIQRAWIGRDDEIRRFGGPDRTLPSLLDELDRLPSDPLVAPLPADLLARLARSSPLLRRAADELRGCEIPDTLVHGDFHLGNVMDGERLVIYDWSDACFAHPFLDIETLLEVNDDDDAVSRVTAGYLSGWEGVAHPATLRRAMSLARPLSALHQVVSYLRILSSVEPDDASDMGEAPGMWLRRSLDLVEALYPEAAR